MYCLKFSYFISKGYDSGCLFRLSLSDVCNKVMNNVINIDETNPKIYLQQHPLYPSFTVPSKGLCHIYLLSLQQYFLYLVFYM